MDSVGLFTPAGEVSYSEEAGRLKFDVGSEQGTRLTAEFERPLDGPLVRATPEWIQANDYIYWRNGVCDRTFYDAGLANPRARAVVAAEVRIENTTPWGQFIEPVPASVLVFEDAIEFAMSPWWNIDELAR